MANELSITIGTTTAVRPIPGTQAKINARFKRFLEFRAVSIDGMTATEVGEAVLLEFAKIVNHDSKEIQRAEELAVNTAAIEAKLEADNPL